ncbi:MAG: hypothetical protein QXU95_03440 [Candidatus Bathyarchaeia archaeon]
MSCLLGFIAATLTMKFLVMKMFPRRGIVGKDVHKADNRELPEMGGVAMLIGTLAAFAVFYGIGLANGHTLAFLLVILLAGVIGIIDRFLKFGGYIKPLLTASTAIPLILFKAYPDVLRLSFGISFRVPTLYALILPIALAVTSNAVNMFDPLNGVASGTSLIALITLYLCSLISHMLGIHQGDLTNSTIYMALVLPSALILFLYNKYPSRVFIGDVGSLSLGAAIGTYAILNGLEMAGVITLMPQITNSFFILSSVGRLFERSEINVRPIVVKPGEVIEPNLNPRAPITLTRFMAVLGYKTEKEIVRAYYKMALFCGALAILAVIFMK